MSHVRDILKQKGGDVATVALDSSALDAATLMHHRRIGAVIVMDGDTIKGIFTERDLMNRVVAVKKDPASIKVRDVMTPRVSCCTPDTTIDGCRSAMTKNKMRHLPVVDNGKLVGIISSGDILARELHDQEETIRYYHEYMQGPN